MQQSFSERLEALLAEKKVSQGEFADAMQCSRQSINFYVLGRRTPDILLAGKMADFFGVSCDYLLGRSEIRQDKSANLTAAQLGLTEDSVRFIAGLHILATANPDPLGAVHAEETLSLLNRMLADERFGVLLQYVKRYDDLAKGKDALALLQNFMMELQSPQTGNIYGGESERTEMLRAFCLHVAGRYFEDIVKDITQ